MFFELQKYNFVILVLFLGISDFPPVKVFQEVFQKDEPTKIA
jgi:hypothetical protein